MKNIISSILLVLTSNLLSGQNYFSSISESEVRTDNSRSIIPQKYEVGELEIEKVKKYLISEVDEKDAGKQLQLLDPEGRYQAFNIFEVKMMEDGLARKYPNIKTYKGYNPNKPSERVHLGFSSTGFYATVVSSNGTYSIDRYADKQDRYYISYYQRDHIDENAISHTCGTVGSEFREETLSATSRSFSQNLPLRIYRFALACTGEFGAFYGPSKEAVLGEMMKSVARMNLVLENDFAIRLVLIADNDKLIWTDAETDPYPDGNTGSTLLNQNTGVLSQNVNFGDFDIGHVYTRGCDDTGGIAFIESVCAGNKGGGVTCHYSNDITAMAIRVAAHEVGHQLGANHTFNNCSGNEHLSTGYEPGSGSTIMSYGGLCGGTLNVVNLSDDYFHISSIIEITRYTRDLFGNSCPELVETTNNIPEVNIDLEDGFFIPISTPFILTGEAVDDEEDELTYTWEQYDIGPSVEPGSPAGNSPLFVSRYPGTDPSRIFPRMDLIVENKTDKREVLPNYARDLNFKFVVRDNNKESGAVAWESIEFFTASSAGPFLVNYPDSTTSFKVGEEVEVLWDVANTDNDLVNCQAVNILLSTDGGYTYNEVLSENTANDGQEVIFIPNAESTEARIKIEAADNIFFDISNQDFTIEAPEQPSLLFGFGPTLIESCVPDDVVIDITTEAVLGFNEDVSFEIGSGLLEDMEVEFSKESILPGENVSAIITFNNPSINSLVELELWAITQEDTIARKLILDLTSTDFSDIEAATPVPGTSGEIVSPFFTWEGDLDATAYRFLLSDNPSFDSLTSTTLYDEILTDTFFQLDDILDKSTVYYWTILGINSCGEGEISEIYTFGTEALSCNSYVYNDVPLGISQSGVIELELPIEVLGQGQVTDVNVLKIRGTHSWVSELRGELVSPSGLEVLLFDKKCGNQSNFNAGFDDDAVGGITCPLSQGIFYQPQEKLDTFIGEDIAGSWVFKLTDTKIGNGGTVQEYVLELCSNVVLESPIVVINNAMPLPSGVGRRISPDFLLAEDANNSSEELVYTLVRLPLNGTLRIDETELNVGDQFTQRDIDNLDIRYTHDGTGETDQFLFTVEDGEGGWVDLTAFDIVIDNNAILDVEDIILPEYKVYPNPSGGLFNIEFDQKQSDVNYRVFDVMGRQIGFSLHPSSNGHQLDLRGSASGLYFVEIMGEGFRDVKKIYIE